MIKRILLLTVFLLTLIMPSVAGATVINVDKTEDTFELGDSGCSLRNAFLSADTDMQQGECEIGSGDDVIRIPTGTYKLDRVGANESGGITGDLDMLEAPSITFEPASVTAKVVIDGNGTDRIFDHVHAGAGTLTIRNIELTNGAPGPGADGGLIRTSVDTVRLEGATLSGGVADFGGAIRVTGGSLEAVNSTFAGNHARTSGGAISTNLSAAVDLRSVTISGNEADQDADGNGDGGGVDFSGIGGAAMTNSILANNTDSSPNPGNQKNDCSSGGDFHPRYVLSTQDLGTLSCSTGPDPGTNKDPFTATLGPLEDNGGPTRTVSIPFDSPALGAGGSADPDKCPETDQRGAPRPAGQCDLGAYEYDPDWVPPHDPEPLPGLSKPTLATAVFDGTRLTILIKCPAKFKPTCSSTVQAKKSKAGAAISDAVKRTIKPGKTAAVKVTVKPAFRELVDSMTYVNARKLSVAHTVKSKKVGKRNAKKPAKLNLSLKVRIKN